ncbi:toll/interleukin-1 receptor domain-containing adapter protein [Pungitius pungitius]|uniref:toll/interleukin-1 receptor domain-containing adapter protein n=1 Tax=Pungitius pungitius TaxID=134920 RepID=UPI0018887FA0|nr:toll/interleukin-1 receptor domain-containing adapter protein [Pungitius pungitius]
MKMLTPGWIQKLWKSRLSSSAGASREQEATVTKKPVCPVGSASNSPPSSSSSSSPPLRTTPSKPPGPEPQPGPGPGPGSPLRWSRKYDVLVCHSSDCSDTSEALRLVSFLEAAPRSLRCFLVQRDACPGGAISTELCQAVRDSHLRALLVTPDFLRDGWCQYMMHQVLSEGPMSNRIIPLVQRLPHSEYPPELRFYCYIDLGRGRDRGYARVTSTVLAYLEDLEKKEKTLEPL